MRDSYEDWADFELQFLIETYPNKTWSVLSIAQKLDRSINSIHQKAFSLGIKRPSRTFPHRNDPAFISDLKKQQPIRQITSKWGCSKSEVDRGRAKLKAESAEVRLLSDARIAISEAIFTAELEKKPQCIVSKGDGLAVIPLDQASYQHMRVLEVVHSVGVES
jgi:hypothetical protein